VWEKILPSKLAENLSGTFREIRAKIYRTPVADTYGLYMFYMKSWTCWESTMQNNPLSIWQNFHFLEIAN